MLPSGDNSESTGRRTQSWKPDWKCGVLSRVLSTTLGSNLGTACTGAHAPRERNTRFSRSPVAMWETADQPGLHRHPHPVSKRKGEAEGWLSPCGYLLTSLTDFNPQNHKVEEAATSRKLFSDRQHPHTHMKIKTKTTHICTNLCAMLTPTVLNKMVLTQ